LKLAPLNNLPTWMRSDKTKKRAAIILLALLIAATLYHAWSSTRASQHIVINVQTAVDYSLIARIIFAFTIVVIVALAWNYELRKLNKQLAARQSELVELSDRLKEDIAARERTEEVLRGSEEKYRILTESMKDVIWTLDTQTLRFLYVSPSVQKLRGYTPEEIIAEPMDAALTPEAVEGLKSMMRQRVEDVLNGKAPPDEYFTTEVEQPCKDGSTVWTEVITNFYLNEKNGHVEVRAVTRDITERNRLKEELQQQAITDELTGAINRRHFIKLASEELKRAQRLNHPMAIAMIDIDLFKTVNDTYGHAAGDQTLLAFTKICQQIVREIDTFARIGGDEFALLLPEASCEQAYAVVQRVHAAVQAMTMNFADQPVHISISSGISNLEGEAQSLDPLLSRADRALYLAKESGRNRIVIQPSPA
jgi:diguanylate cyclase (GGDEF)-like protein/PAS domain S-box-containing protein